MIRKFFILCLFVLNLTAAILAQNNNSFSEKKEKTIFDFNDIYDAREILTYHRIYAFPKCIKIKADFTEFRNEDKSGPVYAAYFILVNLNKEYVSQELFSEIVECLSVFPKGSFDEYYSRIYVADNLQVSHIICFSKDQNKILVDIFDIEGRNSVLLDVDFSLESNAQVSFKIKSSSYTVKDTKLNFPKEFIDAAWYAMWNFQRKDYPRNFVLDDKTAQLYSDIYKELKTKTWHDFCNNYDSIIFIEDLYKNLYSAKPGVLDRMIITELVQRNLISEM